MNMWSNKTPDPFPALKCPERLVYSGKVSYKPTKLHRVGAIVALLAAMLHASEHTLLYMEGITATRELWEMVFIVRKA